MKYRKKPIVVEAEQFTADMAIGKTPPPTGVYKIGGILPNDAPELWWRVRTMEGEIRVSPDDWIIQGVKGELYPCNPDIFEATYDEVAT